MSPLTSSHRPRLRIWPEQRYLLSQLKEFFSGQIGLPHSLSGFRFDLILSPFVRSFLHVCIKALSFSSLTRSPLLCMRTSYKLVTAVSWSRWRRNRISRPNTYRRSTSEWTSLSAESSPATLPPARFCRCALTVFTRCCSRSMWLRTVATRAVAVYRVVSKHCWVHAARPVDVRTDGLE